MPKSKFGLRASSAAMLAVAVAVGCSKPPTQPTTAPPSGITQPVMADLGNKVDASHALAAPEVAAPVVAPMAAAVPVAPALGLAVGTVVPLIPFVSKINKHTKLFVYDRTIADNYALPGAGENITNPSLFSNSRIVFERDDWDGGQIYFYDVVAELLVSFNDVNGLGSVRRPSISFDGTVMTFLLDDRKDEFVGKAMIWINGVVADLAKVNAVGALHCGITWIRLSCDGRWATFTTGDGRLFVYDIINPMVHEIVDARQVGDGFATHPAISPDGTQIAWADDSGQVFRYDRIADLIDPQPFLNAAFNAKYVTDPLFLCWDNAHIYAELSTEGPPLFGKTVHWSHDGYNELYRQRRYEKVEVRTKVFRVVEYNWITETIAGLTILNNVLGEGIQQISDLNEPYEPCDECGFDDRDGGHGH